MGWYVIRTNIKSEDKAETNLRRAGFRTYAPWQRFEKFNKRRKVFVQHQMRIAPRYLFLEVAMPHDMVPWGFIRACEGVERIVGTQGRPIALGPQEVAALKAIMAAEADFAFDETRAGKLHRREIGKNKRETTRMRHAIGSRVTIKDGPFTSFAGEVTNVTGRGHLQVLVSLFGRLSTVDLEPEQVEALAKERRAA